MVLYGCGMSGGHTIQLADHWESGIVIHNKLDFSMWNESVTSFLSYRVSRTSCPSDWLAGGLQLLLLNIKQFWKYVTSYC